jgi:cation:H+ antiporter
VAGLVLLTTGADWLVEGATAAARTLGLSELVVGLTIVAAGTSFPELATSLVATVRGERDLAVGNVVGSNIFNVLWVLGSAAIVSPGGIPIPDGVLTFDLPIMLAVAAACLPIFFTGWMLSRWEGALFLLYYVVYVVHLALNASGHEAERIFGWVVVTFVIPLTVITTLVVWYRGRAPQSPAAR